MRAYQIRRIDARPGTLPPDRLVDPAEIVLPSAGETIVSARTAWAFADVRRGWPVRIPQMLIEDFLVVGE